MRQKKLGNAAKIILIAYILHNLLILTGRGYLIVLPQDEEEDDNLDEEEAGAPVHGDDSHAMWFGSRTNQGGSAKASLQFCYNKIGRAVFVGNMYAWTADSVVATLMQCPWDFEHQD